MTDAVEPAESPVDGQTDLPEADDTIGTDKASQGLLEARDRYRSERDEARTERDGIAARLAQLQTAELHRLAGEHLAVPEDIALSGKQLSEFLTPEGWVDHDAVKAAAAAVIESRPGLAKIVRASAIDRSQGLGSGSPMPPSWASVLTTR